jgi:hypothetical protein
MALSLVCDRLMSSLFPTIKGFRERLVLITGAPESRLTTSRLFHRTPPLGPRPRAFMAASLAANRAAKDISGCALARQ